MKFKFLVLSALFCLSAHFVTSVEVSKTETVQASSSSSFGSGKSADEFIKDGKHVQTNEEWMKASAAAAEQRKTVETRKSDSYEHTIIKTQNKRSNSAKAASKKVEITSQVIRKAVPKTALPCSERLQDEKADCETKAPAGYKGIFDFKDTKDCEWTCSYEALPTEAPKRVTRKVVKVVSRKKEGGKKKTAVAKAPKKECSGERKIKFANCLIKLNGLIAWGDKTKNFDKKFDKLVRNKKSKSKKSKKANK